MGANGGMAVGAIEMKMKITTAELLFQTLSEMGTKERATWLVCYQWMGEIDLPDGYQLVQNESTADDEDA